MAKFKEGISDQLRADHTYQTLKEADKHCTMPQRGQANTTSQAKFEYHRHLVKGYCAGQGSH
jgi:hypothetical protein